MTEGITFAEDILDYPSRVRIVVDNDSGNDQRGLIWGFRNRYYSSAPTARLAYQAEELNPIGGATKVATSGASGGTAVRLAPLWPAWTPVLNTNKGGTAYLTHTGTYRAFAKCIIAGTIQTQARLTWDVGDLVNPTTNDAWTFPSPGAGATKGTAAFIANLGEIRLDASPVGTHRWQGQIEAQTYNTTTGTADWRIDRLWLQPVDEGAGMLTAPQVSAANASSIIAFEPFSHTAGTALATQTAPLGGNWDPGAAGGSTAEDGDADDFTIASNGIEATRNPAGADSSISNGRYEVLSGSSTISTVEVQVDVALPIDIGTPQKRARGGVLARFVDTDNWLCVVREHYVDFFADLTTIWLQKRVAGTITTLGAVSLPYLQGGYYTLKLTVDAAGNYRVYTGPQGGELGAALISGQDTTHLQTGQTLDDGKIGIYDASDLGSAGIRNYDNFKAFAPTATTTVSDAVIYANRSAQLTTDGHYRLDTGGTAYGPVSIQGGDLPRLPVSGLEGRTTEIFIKSSRGDLDQLPDSGIDDVSARVFFRPSYLTLGTI